VKLLLFSDLHLDASFAWAGQQLAWRRHNAARNALRRVAALAVELGADALCCGGDLYEQERVRPDTGEFLRETFAELRPLPVLIAPGNHDWYGPSSLYRSVEWTGNVHVFEEAILRPVALADGFTLWGGAHYGSISTQGFLDRFQVGRGGVNVALFHGSEQGDLQFQETGKPPLAPFYADQIPQSGLRHALLGHFHAPRDAVHYTYPGNPEPLGFGEMGDRGAVLVTVADDGTITRERFGVSHSTLCDVTVELDDVADDREVLQRVADRIAGLSGIVRVTLTGDIEPGFDINLTALRRVAAHLEALVARVDLVNVPCDPHAKDQPHTKDDGQARRGRQARDEARSEGITDGRRRTGVIDSRSRDQRPTPDNGPRVFILASVRLYREGLAQCLAGTQSISVVGESADPVSALRTIMDVRPDVVLVDLGMDDGLRVARRIRDHLPGTRVVALAVSGVSSDIISLAEAGVSAFVTRNQTLGDLVGTVVRTGRGEVVCPPAVVAGLLDGLATKAREGESAPTAPYGQLTTRERQIAALIEAGMSNKEIGRMLSIALPTVKNHVHSVLRKLQVEHRFQAANKFRSLAEPPH
jgi:DNA repair protein SbcD/Mre11